MEIKGMTVLVLGAYGEVGIAICRQLLRYLPSKLVVTSLTEEETQSVLNELQTEARYNQQITSFYGNIFVRWSMRNMRFTDIAASKDHIRTFVDDNFAELSEEILTESTLYKLIIQHQPDIIIDCINTATALSYQNIYQAYQTIGNMNSCTDSNAAIYQLLSTTSIPPLVRHIQILHKSMKQVGTHMYLKIGTTGTGGMGVNLPFTHGEESPSRLLLAKSATAGAQTMLLYTLSKAPGWPIIKEIKPAAMIGWKGIDKKTVKRSGRTYPLYDCLPEEAYNLKVRGFFHMIPQENKGAPREKI